MYHVTVNCVKALFCICDILSLCGLFICYDNTFICPFLHYCLLNDVCETVIHSTMVFASGVMPFQVQVKKKQVSVLYAILKKHVRV